MKEAVMKAHAAVEKPGSIRRKGFTPGVVYGGGIETPLRLETNTTAFLRVLAHMTKNTRVRVEAGGMEFRCIIKELQKNPVTGEILHFDLQTVSDENMIRLRLPVTFSGKSGLGKLKYILHAYMQDLYVAGRADLMPERIIIDVEGRKPGDKIMVRDIKLSDGLKLLDDKNEIIAAVTAAKELEAAS